MIRKFWYMQKLLITCFIVTTTCLNIAEACSRMPSDETDEFADFKKAKYVFRGLVTKVEIVSGAFLFDKIALTKVYYNPIEVLKGNVPVDGYMVSQTGYFGGCAVPALVGLEYIFAPSMEGLVLNLNNHSELGELIERSIGMISIFNTAQLPGYEPKLDEALSELREWATKQK